MIRSIFSGKRKFIIIPLILVLAFPLLPFLIGLPIAWLIKKRVGSGKLRYGLMSLVLVPTIFIGIAWATGVVSPPKLQKTDETSQTSNIVPTSTSTPEPTTTITPKQVATPSLTTTPTTTKTPTPTTKSKPNPTATTKPTSQPTTQSFSGDKDCKDFATHAAAQAYFNSKGGSTTRNIDNLDSDGDGIACENLP